MSAAWWCWSWCKGRAQGSRNRSGPGLQPRSCWSANYREPVFTSKYHEVKICFFLLPGVDWYLGSRWGPCVPCAPSGRCVRRRKSTTQTSAHSGVLPSGRPGRLPRTWHPDACQARPRRSHRTPQWRRGKIRVVCRASSGHWIRNWAEEEEVKSFSPFCRYALHESQLWCLHDRVIVRRLLVDRKIPVIQGDIREPQ